MKKARFVALTVAALVLAAHVCGDIVQRKDSGSLGKAVIISPSEKEFVSGEEIKFYGILNDSGFIQTAGYSYVWSSNRDGVFGWGVGVSVKNLSVGEHVIEFIVSDGGGNSVSDRMEATIKPVRLTVTILSTDPEGFYQEGESFFLDARVSGGTPPYSFLWKLDGTVLSTKRSLEKNLPEGTYGLELTVRDSAGSAASDSKGLYVSGSAAAEGKQLYVAIESPESHQTFREGSSVEFSATVSGGLEPYSLVWVSDNEGIIGYWKNFSLNNLSGEHKSDTIRVKVIDGEGNTASDSVGVMIEKACVADGSCKPGEDYVNCPEDCAGFMEGHCDGLVDGICDPDCERTDDVDCLCNMDGICERDYENHEKCPEDCPSGSPDGFCDGTGDGICDPDCEGAEDTDCTRNDSMNYFILLVIALLTIFFYARFIRR